MRYTLTLLQQHLDELKKLVHIDDNHEMPAILLCGYSLTSHDPWNASPETRFLSKKVLPVPKAEIISSGQTFVNWKTDSFIKTLKIAREEGLAVCLVHSHPAGAYEFSESIDNVEEKELFTSLYQRNPGSAPNLSLIISYDGQLTARAVTPALKYFPIELIRIIGDRFLFHYPGKYDQMEREMFHRQQLAFGKTLGNDLSKLRIVIIGCGATGSATAQLLVRLGIGQLLLIDKDLMERSNLSRVHGATAADADGGKSKAFVLYSQLSSLGMGCRLRYLEDWVGSEKARDAVKSADIVFSCTDDNSGRIFLNRFAHFYLIPVIDMGIVIEPGKKSSDQLLALQGRLTLILPGYTCLLCRNIVNTGLAREEDLLRSDPLGYERQKQEAYVTGEGNPSPAVITFTTEVATMAVNEFINRLTGFKKIPPEKHLVRFFDQGVDRRPGGAPKEYCPICSRTEYWGRGDTEPFMDQTN